MIISYYSCKFTWDPRDGLYVVTSFEFPWLSAVGETREEALGNFEEVLEEYTGEYKADGADLPEPLEITQFSGQLRLQIPRSLHKRLAELAEHEGVSLNTLLVQMLSESTAPA